jgi:hypothetical protein
VRFPVSSVRAAGVWSWFSRRRSSFCSIGAATSRSWSRPSGKIAASDLSVQRRVCLLRDSLGLCRFDLRFCCHWIQWLVCAFTGCYSVYNPILAFVCREVDLDFVFWFSLPAAGCPILSATNSCSRSIFLQRSSFFFAPATARAGFPTEIFSGSVEQGATISHSSG